MGRPKKGQTDEQAVVKMQDAFWRLLQDSNARDISVTALAREAGVNKNSFYYHYSNMDEFVEDSVRSLLDPNIPLAILSLIRGESMSLRLLATNLRLESRARKVLLFVRQNDSRAHREMFIKELLAVWLQASERSEEDFTEEEMMALRFVLVGLFDLIGSWDFSSFEEAASTQDTSMQDASMQDKGVDGLPKDAFIRSIESLLGSPLIATIGGIVFPILFPNEQNRPVA